MATLTDDAVLDSLPPSLLGLAWLSQPSPSSDGISPIGGAVELKSTGRKSPSGAATRVGEPAGSPMVVRMRAVVVGTAIEPRGTSKDFV